MMEKYECKWRVSTGFYLQWMMALRVGFDDGRHTYHYYAAPVHSNHNLLEFFQSLLYIPLYYTITVHVRRTTRFGTYTNERKFMHSMYEICIKILFRHQGSSSSSRSWKITFRLLLPFSLDSPALLKWKFDRRYDHAANKFNAAPKNLHIQKGHPQSFWILINCCESTKIWKLKIHLSLRFYRSQSRYRNPVHFKLFINLFTMCYWSRNRAKNYATCQRPIPETI